MAAARAQRAAVDTLRSGNLGVWIVYDYQDDESDVPRALPGPTWQRLLFGVDFVSDVAWVHFYRGFPGPTFSDEVLKPIADLKRLKGFRAPWSMSDAGLRHLAGLKELRGVDLSESRVTDAGLVNLQGLTKLESLNLNHTNITDAGLAHLEELSNLKKLYLENTRISDSGLYHLSRLAKLEDLLVASSRVTRDGAATLHRVLPRCRVSPWQESLGPATVDNHEDGEANATK